MACQYFVGGKFISELEFKQLLEEGLLDQLISSSKVNIDKFKLNEEYINKAYSGLAIEDFSIPVHLKHNGTHNTERTVIHPKKGDTFIRKLGVANKNPLKVIEESNNQIEQENKTRKESRPKNNFILGVKLGGAFKFGKLPLELLQKVQSNAQNAKLLSELKEVDEGVVYMFVPSAYGYSPIRLFTPFLGQSNKANEISSQLKTFFDTALKDNKEITNKTLNGLSYRTKFVKNEKGVGIKQTTYGSDIITETYYETFEDFRNAVLGKWDAEGNYTGEAIDGKNTENGLLSLINAEEINGGSYNEIVSNNGFLYTDAFSEGGNFFNSVSFSVKLNKIEGIQEDLERLRKDKKVVKDIEQEVENSIAKNAATPTAPTNQDTKKDESALNNIPVPEDIGEDGDIAMLMGMEFIPGIDGKPIAEKETPSEDFGDDFFNNGDASNSDFEFGDGVKTKLEKTGWSYQQQNKIDLEKELQYIKDKVGQKGLEIGSFKTIASLRKYFSEEVYSQLQEVGKNGKSVRGLFTEAAVFLSERAFEGTGYHEAFHVVFNLSLTLPQRIQLLNEARTKFSKELEGLHGANPTFIQIEELLADKFQEYVKTKGTADSSLGARISNYFKALFRKLQMFFSKNSRVSLNDIFEDINIGVYKNKRISFKNTDLSKINPNLIRFKVEKKFESENIEYESIQLFQHFSNNMLNELRKTAPDTYEGLNDAEIINEIGVGFFYNKLLQSLANHGKAVRDRLAIEKKENNREMLRAIFNNIEEAKNVFTNEGKSFKAVTLEDGSRYYSMIAPNDFINRFNRSLKESGIKINFNINTAEEASLVEDLEDDLEEAEDTTQNIEERWQRASAEFNPINTASQYLRRRLSTFPILTEKGNAVRNSLGAPTYYNMGDVFNYLGKELTDSYSPYEMMDKLKALKKTKGYMNNVYELAVSDYLFRSELFLHLAAKTFAEYTLVYESEGDYRIMAANQKSFKKTVNEKFVGEFLVQENTLFNKYPVGHPQAGQRNFESIKIAEVKKRKEELQALSTTVTNSGARTKEEVGKLLELISKTFAKNSINLTISQLELIWAPPRERETASFNNLLQLINSGVKLFQQLENNKNPFLHLTPIEYINDKEMLTSERPLENFAAAAFFAFDNELVAAHRNANNKSVYAIQLSNALTKKISTLTNQKKFDQYMLKIKNDPLLSKMPFFKIIAESGKLNNNAANLKVTVFDALSRKGKKKSVEYANLSPAEMVATQLALFHNNASKNYSKFTLPTPSDATTMAAIQFKKQTIEEVVEGLVDTAEAEIARILNFNNSSKNSLLRLIENYNKRAGKFQVLSFLQGKVDPETATREEIKEVIVDFLENEFYENEINKYIEKGVILKYNKETGKINFGENIITKSQIGNKEAFFKQWLFNQYFLNTQMTTIFAGDPAQYKGTIDYQKRYKQLLSPGMLTNPESGNPSEYSGYIFKDEKVSTKKEIAKDIIENIKNSNLSDYKKKELTALWEGLSTEESNDIADGATFISVDRMIAIYDSLGKLTKEHKDAAERIKKGIELPQDAGLFRIIKPFQTTKIYVEGVEVNAMFKNSEFVLTKNYAKRSPKLMKAYELLNDPVNPVDFIAFESAIKTGKIANNVTDKGKSIFSSIEVVNGKGELSEDAYLMTLSQEDYRLQQETPNKFQDKDGNFGSQLRVLMIADMNMEGDYEINGKPMKGKEVAKLYQDLIVQNLKESFEEVQNMFLDENGDVNYEVLVQHLKREAEERDLEEDLLTALELVPDVLNPGKKVPALPLWHPAISYKMESLFNSFFKNRVTKQKIHGGSLINVTSYGVSESLNYDAKTNTFEALLPLWTKKFFPKTKDGNIDLSAIPEELTKMIAYRIPTEDKYSVFNIKVVGFTDASVGGSIVLPAEATTLAGLDFDIDKLFMAIPNFYIDKDGKPKYMSYLNKDSTASEIINTIIGSKTKLEEFINKYIDKDSGEAFLNLYQEAEIALADIYKEKKDFYKNQDIKKIKERLTQSINQRKLEKDPNTIKVLSQEINELFEIIEEKNEIEGVVEMRKEAFKELEKALIAAITPIKDTINVEELNTKKSRDNKIMELMIGIMRNPHTQMSSIDPGNFDKLIEISNELRIMKISITDAVLEDIRARGLKLIKNRNKIEIKEYRNSLEKLIEELEEQDFNINYPSTQLEIFERNMVGQALIGPFANHNTNHAKALFTDLQTATPLAFNEKEYSALNQQEVDGVRVSKGLASKLAAVVDNASNPVSAHLNLNMYTVNLIALMTRLGISDNMQFMFMNQPVVIELTRAYFRERGSLKQEKERINLLKIKWARALAKKVGKSEAELQEAFKFSPPNINESDLYEALMEPESDTFYQVQFNVLQAFSKYINIAKELGEVVQSSRVDTKGVGPTNGENYAMLNRQEKMLSKNEPEILNANQLIQETSALTLNPSFQKYGWLKPVSLMNKIFPAIGEITEFGDINYSILGKIKNFFSTLKDEAYTISKEEARQIDNHFLTYLVSYSPFFKPKAEDGSSIAFKILDETPDKLRKYKKENPDSKYTRFLEQLATKDGNKNTPFRHISFYNTGRQNTDTATFKRMWLQMMKDSDPTTRELAFDLVKYTYFTNGFNFGPFTFFNIIPLEFFTDEFAKAPENADIGLIDKKGRTMNQGIQEALRLIQEEANSGSEEVSESALSGHLASRFIRQFAQATAAKSMIIPEVEAFERIENISSTNITSLKENEVLVLVTGNNGTLNSGAQARIAFDGKTSHNPVPGKVGIDKGNMATYGDPINKISQGTLGRSFLVPGFKEIQLEDGTFQDAYAYYKELEKSNPKEYEKQRNEQYAKLKTSLIALAELAEKEADTRFLVNDLRTPFRFNSTEIRQLLLEVGNIPLNIKLVRELGEANNIIKRNYETRNNKIQVYSTGGILALSVPTYGTNYLKRKGEFPAYVTALINKQTVLFTKRKETDNGVDPTVQYIQVNTTGISNYVLQYDINNPIKENLTDKLSKKLMREISSSPELEFFNDGGALVEGTADAEMMAAMESFSPDLVMGGVPSAKQDSPKTTKETKEDKNPLGILLDSSIMNQLTDLTAPTEAAQEFEATDLIDQKETSKPTNLTYNNYLTTFGKALKEGRVKQEELIDLDNWNNVLTPEVKANIISCL